MEESGGDSVVREDPEGLQSQEEPISTGEESSETNTNAVIASQVMPQASETGEDVYIYQLKWVEIGGVFVPIIVQNENGPCPLLAICNVLILRGAMKILPGNSNVSSTYLLDLLGTYLLEQNHTQELSEGEKANLERNILDTMTIFPRLPTGLDVNVRFDSVSGFEFTREICLFDLVGVPLYHGWVEDPQNSQYCKVLKNLSYNQLVEKIITDTSSDDEERVQQALLGQQFLESTASQLTYHGLCELNMAVNEGDFCVFFRNNHFNSLTKKQGQLYTLVTDQGFLNELGYIWQSLSDIDGGGDFLDAKFNPSPQSESQALRRDKTDQEKSNETTPTSDSSPQKSNTGSHGDVQVEEKPSSTDSDYQAALHLQQQLYIQEEDEGAQVDREQQQQQQHWKKSSPQKSSIQSDHELAAALQQEENQQLAAQPQAQAQAQPQPQPQPLNPPSTGPNTAEEYERASVQDRNAGSSSGCCIL